MTIPKKRLNSGMIAHLLRSHALRAIRRPFAVSGATLEAEGQEEEKASHETEDSNPPLEWRHLTTYSHVFPCALCDTC